MEWDLPTSVEIDGKEYKIRNKCDYRVVLDTVLALEDEELPELVRASVAIKIFYEDSESISADNFADALNGITYVISCGKPEKASNSDSKSDDDLNPNKVRMIYWEHDFPIMAPAVSRVLGYSIRDKNNYTHWYDFNGAIGLIDKECYFARILGVRSNLVKGKPPSDMDKKFYSENIKDIVPNMYSEQDDEWLITDD